MKQSAQFRGGKFHKGLSDMLVLLMLNIRQMHGYEIIQKLDPVVSLKQGTVYPLLLRLERRGFIRGRWDADKVKRKRHNYKITSKGKKFLKELSMSWIELVLNVNALVGESGIREYKKIN